jgi:DNA-binding transcriptional LysR family regulator
MELRQLRYFVAVAEELHFRRAAERLYVAQPAVSEQIRKLEVELGVQVFDRSPRGVALTEAGSALLEEARRMLELAETAQRAARTAHDRAASRLRIAYLPESLPGAFPRALRRLAAHAPNVEVTLETGPAMKLIDAVRERRADAVITALPAPVDGLRTTLLGDEHLVAAVPVSDDRALEPALTLERIATSRLLLPPRDANPAFHNAVVSMYRNEGLSPNLTELPEPRADLAMLAVASGAGIALLPRSVKDRHSGPGIRLVDVTAPEPVFQYAALTHPDDDGLPTRALVHALAHAADQPSAIPAPAPVPALALVA